MSLIFATQLTAVATAALAVFAIVTAWYARSAFRAQFHLLMLQREQLNDQREANFRQAKVLGLQADDLRESLDERKREASARRRVQASQIQISIDPRAGNTMRATIMNSSAQALHAAELRWLLDSESYGDPNPELLGTIPPMSDCTTERGFPANTDREAADAILTFRDAAASDGCARQTAG